MKGNIPAQVATDSLTHLQGLYYCYYNKHQCSSQFFQPLVMIIMSCINYAFSFYIFVGDASGRFSVYITKVNLSQATQASNLSKCVLEVIYTCIHTGSFVIRSTKAQFHTKYKQVSEAPVS